MSLRTLIGAQSYGGSASVPAGLLRGVDSPAASSVVSTLSLASCGNWVATVFVVGPVSTDEGGYYVAFAENRVSGRFGGEGVA